MTDRQEEQRIDTEIHRVADGSDPFAAAVRATRMPMLITDPRQPDNPIVFVNDAFARLTGYERSETLGRNCRFLQGPETSKEDVRRVGDAIERRVPIEVELLNYRKDGVTFWNRLLISPVFNDGKLTFFFASQFDVTREKDRLTRLAADREMLEAEIEDRLGDLDAAHERMKFILAAARLGAWTLDLTNLRLVASAQFKAIFGHHATDPLTLDDLMARLSDEDRMVWQTAFDNALKGDGYLEADLHIRMPGEEPRWIEIRSKTRFDDHHQPISMAGVVLDITDRRTAETHRDLLTSELSHRVKNTLATVQAIVGRSLRESEVEQELVTKISDRLKAIASVHDVLTHRGWVSANIDEIIAEVIKPYNIRHSRIAFGGPSVSVSARAATSLALALHELASNAMKYGSLSNQRGTVTINWEKDGDDLRLVWSETGGPKVSEPARRGFGSLLIETLLATSTYGTTDLDYRTDGLVFTFIAPRDTLLETDSIRAY